ncbi:acyl dehydratase [Rhodoligotrophos appendicifer]|uniref:MaoC/PaaZ C-terminal domain-containing protein n=1 Tax=Rhodoligotrophos appendicifer TaxID=987056 RepID=UPI001478F6B7|nr:MaoC/PaaZ C-terminal domain-containing protein [Rhodoligotrophos appendicifer]
MISLYFEDLELNQTFETGGRTITEADSTFFCMLSGDWAQLHCDAEYARATSFGQRVVGGAFGFLLVAGAYTQWGIFNETGLAMLSVCDWQFTAPIFIGDTLRVRMLIAAKRETSKPDRGIIDRKITILNQKSEEVQSGHSKLLIKRRITT